MERLLSEVYTDLQKQFYYIAYRYQHSICDPVVWGVDDLVAEGMLEAWKIIRDRPDVPAEAMKAICIRAFVQTCADIRRSVSAMKARPEGGVTNYDPETMPEPCDGGTQAQKLRMQIFFAELRSMLNRTDANILAACLEGNKPNPLAIKKLLSIPYRAAVAGLQRVQAVVIYETGNYSHA